VQSRPEGVGGEPQFTETDEFFRRVHPRQWNHAKDRVSSAAFTPERMSVNWAALSSAEATLQGYEGHGVVSITAKLCWELGQ
jgi:hypothetical protein